MDTKKLLGHRIRALRKAKGFTIEELAEAADLSPTFLGQTERGKHIPSIRTCERLAHILGVSLSRLFDFGRLEKAQRSTEDDRTINALIALIRSSKKAHVLFLLDAAKSIRSRFKIK